MAKQAPIPEDATFAELVFPTGGIHVATEFELQPAKTTPAGVNVRGYEALTQRQRGGSRCGLSKYPSQQVPEGSHLIQHLNAIVDPTEDALLANFDPLDGPSVDPDGFSEGGIPDPSTNNRIVRNPGATFSGGVVNPDTGRYVRTGGSGIQINRNRKPRRRAPIAYVQSDHTFSIFGAPASVAYPDDVLSASLLLVAVLSISDAPASAAVADSHGDSFALAAELNLTGSVLSALSVRLSLWYYISVGAGPNTVTATVAGANTTTELMILEYTGVAAMAFGPLDGTSTNSVNPSPEGPVTTGPVTIGEDGELLFGVFYMDGNYTVGSGFTQRMSTLGLSVVDRIGPAQGAVEVTGTAELLDGYLAIGASFKQG